MEEGEGGFEGRGEEEKEEGEGKAEAGGERESAEGSQEARDGEPCSGGGEGAEGGEGGEGEEASAAGCSGRWQGSRGGQKEAEGGVRCFWARVRWLGYAAGGMAGEESGGAGAGLAGNSSGAQNAGVEGGGVGAQGSCKGQWLSKGAGGKRNGDGAGAKLFGKLGCQGWLLP